MTGYLALLRLTEAFVRQMGCEIRNLPDWLVYLAVGALEVSTFGVPA